MRDTAVRRILVPLLATAVLACSREPESSEPTAAGPHAVFVTGFEPESEIRAIKALRAETDMGLAKAKGLLDGLPETTVLVAVDLTSEAAEALRARLAEAGMESSIGTYRPPGETDASGR